MFMMCTKIDFSNCQSTITGITLFPDEELFILALYFALLQQPISIPTFSSAFLNYYFRLFCEVMFMTSLYTYNFRGCAVLSEGNMKTAKLSLMLMFSLSFFLMYIFPRQ